jgi:hypothetical protein
MEDTDTMTAEAVETEVARQESVLEAMRAEGIPTETGIYDDYFGFQERHRVTLPDGVSWVEHQTLNEGARRRYLNDQNREVKVQKVTGDAILKMQTGEERASLLKAAIVNWDLRRLDEKTKELVVVPFSDQRLRDFLEKAPPSAIDPIEKDVRKHNPWLLADVTVEDIDRQIKELNDMKEQKIREAEGKGS